MVKQNKHSTSKVCGAHRTPFSHVRNEWRVAEPHATPLLLYRLLRQPENGKWYLGNVSK